MRKNNFGDICCHTAAEARHIIGGAADEPYLPSHVEPSEGNFGFRIKVAELGSGDLICYIEAPTVEGVGAIVNDQLLKLRG